MFISLDEIFYGFINRCIFYCIINMEYRDSGWDFDINSFFCDSI